MPFFCSYVAILSYARLFLYVACNVTSLLLLLLWASLKRFGPKTTQSTNKSTWNISLRCGCCCCILQMPYFDQKKNQKFVSPWCCTLTGIVVFGVSFRAHQWVSNKLLSKCCVSKFKQKNQTESYNKTTITTPKSKVKAKGKTNNAFGCQQTFTNFFQQQKIQRTGSRRRKHCQRITVRFAQSLQVGW